ncbi:hypothetical protein F4604DRAFT_1684118 [Suillus subluteus]|nr:hypothetical protein F4604DRAFT_1684118 [Suillus subluteus]
MNNFEIHTPLAASELVVVHHGHILATVLGIHAPEVAPSFVVASPQCHSIFVQTETTPNDDSLKFIPGLGIGGEGIAECRTSQTVPQARDLLNIHGVIFRWLTTFGSQEDRETAGPQDTQILDTDSEMGVLVQRCDIEVGNERMLMYYMLKVKGVKGVEQACSYFPAVLPLTDDKLDEEEAIALDELAKLEERLVKNGKNKDSSDINQTPDPKPKEHIITEELQLVCLRKPQCLRAHPDCSTHHPLFPRKVDVRYK